MLQDLQEQPFKAAAGPPGALFTQRFANSRLRLTTLVLRRQVGSRFIAAGASAAAPVTAVTGTVCCCSVSGACCRCCALRATGVSLPQINPAFMPLCACSPAQVLLNKRSTIYYIARIAQASTRWHSCSYQCC